MVTEPLAVFRADASTSIGAGHVMRCLTLADALRKRGWRCRFICREHPGHLAENISSRGHVVQLLPAKSTREGSSRGGYVASLGASPEEDAAAVIASLDGDKPTWIVVDNYALGAEWEKAVFRRCDHLMVIDDLADRAHHCDLLLDQTFGRTSADYSQHVSSKTALLCGADYVLLRQEFASYRDQTLGRRARTDNVRQILVSLGGGDSGHLVSRVLELLISQRFQPNCLVKVVTGWHSSQIGAIERVAQRAPFDVELLQGVDAMAPLMAASDLAIGAAGSSSWERCCLGLPTVLLVVADNQRTIGERLAAAGAARIVELDDMDDSLPSAVAALTCDHAARQAMTVRSASIVDGLGAGRVVAAMETLHAE